MSAQGWYISNESIEGGHIKGGEACCGGLICLPLAATAGRTPGFIVVTYARERKLTPLAAHCNSCGMALPANAQFCRRCGKRVG